MEALSSLPIGGLWINTSQAFTSYILGQTRGTKNKHIPSVVKGYILVELTTLERTRTCGLECRGYRPWCVGGWLGRRQGAWSRARLIQSAALDNKDKSKKMVGGRDGDSYNPYLALD